MYEVKSNSITMFLITQVINAGLGGENDKTFIFFDIFKWDQ
jgi:hypothetical protein